MGEVAISPGSTEARAASVGIAALADRMDLDAHAHVFRRPARGALGSRYLPDYDASLTDWIGHLKRHGLAGGTLVQPSFLGSDNTQLLAAIAEARASGMDVTGSAVVPFDTPLAALEALVSDHVVSVRLNLIGRPAPDEAQLRDLSEKCAEAGLGVELHMEAARADLLCATITSSGATLVLDHFGLAATEKELAALLPPQGASFTFIKASAHYRLPGPATGRFSLARRLLGTAIERTGVDRILWGTDWPHTRHESEIDFGAAFSTSRSLSAAAGLA